MYWTIPKDLGHSAWVKSLTFWKVWSGGWHLINNSYVISYSNIIIYIIIYHTCSHCLGGNKRFQNFLVIRDQIIRMSRTAMSFDAPFRLSKDRWGQHQTTPTLARDAWCLKWRDNAHHLSAKGSACPNSLI